MDNLLNVFKHFLRNRKQVVVLNGQCSSWIDCKAGVPQGSIIRPLLILICINDLVYVLIIYIYYILMHVYIIYIYTYIYIYKILIKGWIQWRHIFNTRQNEIRCYCHTWSFKKYIYIYIYFNWKNIVFYLFPFPSLFSCSYNSLANIYQHVCIWW